jgi:hypothetical protein
MVVTSDPRWGDGRQPHDAARPRNRVSGWTRKGAVLSGKHGDAIVAFGSFYPGAFVIRRPRERRARIAGERRKDFQTLL